MIFHDKHKLRQFMTNLPAQRYREAKTVSNRRTRERIICK